MERKISGSARRQMDRETTTNDSAALAVLDDPPPDEQQLVEPSAFGLIDMLLKRPGEVDRLNRQPMWQRELFPRFLLITLASYLIYAAVMLLLTQLAPAAASLDSFWLPLPALSFRGGSALALPLAYALGVVLAACVCLPSFYFYSLLAGIRLSFLQIVSLVGKGMAATSMLLLGVLPIYVAIVLGMIIFGFQAEQLKNTLALGLCLPFLVGPWGLQAIFRGILSLSDALPEAWQCQRRCFLRRLTLAWAAVYAAVAPVMIYRLWVVFAGLFSEGVTSL